MSWMPFVHVCVLLCEHVLSRRLSSRNRRSKARSWLSNWGFCNDTAPPNGFDDILSEVTSLCEETGWGLVSLLRRSAASLQASAHRTTHNDLDIDAMCCTSQVGRGLGGFIPGCDSRRRSNSCSDSDAGPSAAARPLNCEPQSRANAGLTGCPAAHLSMPGPGTPGVGGSPRTLAAWPGHL